MTNLNNKITLDENKELYDKAYSAVNAISTLNDKRHNWFTNASIGLLGYFVALLVQLKIESKIPFIIFVVIIMTLLCVNIILGLIYKFLYEKKHLDKNTLEMLINSKKIFISKSESDPKKNAYYSKLIEQVDKDIYKIDKNPYEKKTIFVKGFVNWQMIIFAIAIVLMVIYYCLYLFGN